MGKDTFELAGRSWPKVQWWRMKGMRTLYLTLWAALLTLLTSATNGKRPGHLEDRTVGPVLTSPF